MATRSRFAGGSARRFGLLCASLLAALVQVGCASRNDSDEVPLRPDRADLQTVQGIEFRGELAVMESFPVQLGANVTVTNVSNEERTVSFPDGCVVLLRAYRGNERVWDQGLAVGCTMAIVDMQLGPGDSQIVRGRATAYEILGDSLPDGVYRIAAYLRPDGELVELDLGETDLAVPR